VDELHLQVQKRKSLKVSIENSWEIYTNFA
jgi:hypothetical protein